jgi:hypothetical protein
MAQGFDGNEFDEWEYEEQSGDCHTWTRGEYKIAMYPDERTDDAWFVTIHANSDTIIEEDGKREAFKVCKNHIKLINKLISKLKN